MTHLQPANEVTSRMERDKYHVWNRSTPFQEEYSVIFVERDGSWRFVDGRHTYEKRQAAYRRCKALNDGEWETADTRITVGY